MNEVFLKFDLQQVFTYDSFPSTGANEGLPRLSRRILGELCDIETATGLWSYLKLINHSNMKQ